MLGTNLRVCSPAPSGPRRNFHNRSTRSRFGGLRDPGLAPRLKEQVECLSEQLLNGAVLFESEQLELFRDAGVEVANECLFTPAAGGSRLQAWATHKSGIGNDLPPRTSPPSKLDSEPFEVPCTG